MQCDWFMYHLRSTYKNRLEYPFNVLGDVYVVPPDNIADVNVWTIITMRSPIYSLSLYFIPIKTYRDGMYMNNNQ